MVCCLVSIYFDSPQPAIHENKLFQKKFSEKGLGLNSPPYFVYDFLQKMFLMLHSIN